MKGRSLLLLPTAPKRRSWAPGAQCRSWHHHMASLTPSSQHRNTPRLKDKRFMRRLFLMHNPSSCTYIFGKTALNLNQCPQPIPESHGRASVSSENTTRNPHTTTEQLLSHNGCGCTAKSEASWHRAALWPLASHASLVCEQGSIALDVQQTAGRKGWPTIPFTPLA